MTGTRRGETVEPQEWSEDRFFPGAVVVEDRGPALQLAGTWTASGTIWTDGSRLDSGEVGAACAWKKGSGWHGRRFHLGNNKEVFDAEVFAIYQTLRVFESRQGTGRPLTISQTPRRRFSVSGRTLWARASSGPGRPSRSAREWWPEATASPSDGSWRTAGSWETGWPTSSPRRQPGVSASMGYQKGFGGRPASPISHGWLRRPARGPCTSG